MTKNCQKWPFFAFFGFFILPKIGQKSTFIEKTAPLRFKPDGLLTFW